jgi:ABC-2 type transport system permease protein
MIAVLRAALIIARRDYVATVWSRAFILFLIGPLFPIIFGLMFGTIGSRMQTPPPVPVIAVIATPAQAATIDDARARLAGVFGVDAVPRLKIAPPHADQTAQRERLLAGDGISAVLSGLPDAPALYGPAHAIDQYAPVADLLVVDMRNRAAMEQVKIVQTPVKLVRTAEQQAKTSDSEDRVTLARGAQLVLLVLTMILAGMLLSNMMEEKSSKVIEILAAAVPIDAIFIGKLIAMLGMSLTGIAIWSMLALGGAQMIGPGVAQLAEPAVGWPMFVILGVLYFMASYLLLGALFLGIGAQASTVREVQTLSMPVSMGQLVIFALAAATVEQPDSTAATAAMIFPWSSPFAMLARAAERPELWPHLIALPWQMLAIALIIRIGARLFRRSVLKSGGPGFWRQLIGRSSSAR